jgi:hypothetical protein
MVYVDVKPKKATFLKKEEKERKKAKPPRRKKRDGGGCKKIKDEFHISRLNCVMKRMRISARLLLPGSPPQTWRNSG